MSKKSKTVSTIKKKQEQEKKKKKALKIIAVASASILAASAIILLAVFVIKPVVEKKKAEKETEQTTAVSVEPSEDGYAEYKGCKMPEEFVKILLQAEADSEASCNELGVAAEIGDHKLSVPEYALYYYRAVIDQFTKAVSTLYEKGQNVTGFDPSKAPSSQNYPRGNITWETKISEKIETETEKSFFMFDEAINSRFMPSKDVIDNIYSLYESLSVSAKSGDIDCFISEKYFDGLTFAMFMKKYIIIEYADAYAQSLEDEKATSYSESYVKETFYKEPGRYKNVTVNIFPVENPDSVDNAKKVRNLVEYIEFVKNEKNSPDCNPEMETLYYGVSYTSISDYFGETVSEWIFSSDRKIGDATVVKGAIYNCLIYIRELPKVTHSRDILMVSASTDDFSTIDDAYNQLNKIYEELGSEKMTEEKCREYLSENTSNYEFTVFVGDFEPELDKWIHSEERKRGDSICFKGSESAYIVMFIRDNPEDTYAAASIRKETAADEVEKFIEANAYEFSINDKIAKKSVEIAEAKYLEYYEKNKDNLGL